MSGSGGNSRRDTPWWESLFTIGILLLGIYLTYPDECHALLYRVRVRLAAPAAERGYTQARLEAMKRRYAAGGYVGDREPGQEAYRDGE